MNGLQHGSLRTPNLRGRAPVAVAVLLLTGLLAGLGPTPGAYATINPGSIAGTVTDTDGDPLPGITVWVSMAEVRNIEAGRRADQLQAELAAVSTRVAELEHPTPPEPEPERSTLVEERGQRRVDDADWIVGGWRAHNWQ